MHGSRQEGSSTHLPARAEGGGDRSDDRVDHQHPAPADDERGGAGDEVALDHLRLALRLVADLRRLRVRCHQPDDRHHREHRRHHHGARDGLVAPRPHHVEDRVRPNAADEPGVAEVASEVVVVAVEAVEVESVEAAVSPARRRVDQPDHREVEGLPRRLLEGGDALDPLRRAADVRALRLLLLLARVDVVLSCGRGRAV